MSSNSTSASAGPPALAADQTVTDLSARFPDKVQIHLHPSSSLPPSLLAHLPSTSSASTLPVALVWTVDSLRLLRGYGVVGSFTGTLAQFPQQNVFLGLPVQLLPEEVVFLLRRGWGVVVDETSSYRGSTVEERKRVEGRIEGDRRGQQLEAWYEREALRAKHSSTGSKESRPPTDKELEVLPWHYTIPTLSSALPWYTPSPYTTLSSIQHLFPYPSTPRECASVGLFEHLLSTRLWCMNGLRFGGSFAVYPGDPLRYHSHYTAQLLLPQEDVGLTGVVANGRLGTSVKKTHLLCTVERFDGDLDREWGKGEGEGKGEKRGALECVRSGRFDTASKGEKGKGEGEGKARAFASFNIFSLAWAGFGT